MNFFIPSKNQGWFSRYLYFHIFFLISHVERYIFIISLFWQCKWKTEWRSFSTKFTGLPLLYFLYPIFLVFLGFFCLYSPIFCNFLLYSPIFLRNLLYEIFHYINFCFYGFCGNYILLNFSENNTKKVDHNLWAQYSL